MSGKPSSNEKAKEAPSQDRRRFLQSALGAGLALGATSVVRASEPRLGGTARVRVGLIGTDGHTGVILESIPQLPGVELTAFAKSLPDDDVSSLKRTKAFSEKTRIYDHFEQMLEKEELDVVGVCLPYFRNAEASIAAARRGVHVVSEKPVATALEGLAALKNAVAAGLGLAREQGPSRIPWLSGPRGRLVQTRQRRDGHDQPRLPAPRNRANPRGRPVADRRK